MQDDGSAVQCSAEGVEFWGGLAGNLLHPLQLQTIEAMRWIDQPLSATDLEKILEKEPGASTTPYHFGRLRKLGVLRFVETQRKRGAHEMYYRLSGASDRAQAGP